MGYTLLGIFTNYIKVPLEQKFLQFWEHIRTFENLIKAMSSSPRKNPCAQTHTLYMKLPWGRQGILGPSFKTHKGYLCLPRPQQCHNVTKTRSMPQHTLIRKIPVLSPWFGFLYYVCLHHCWGALLCFVHLYSHRMPLPPDPVSIK